MNKPFYLEGLDPACAQDNPWAHSVWQKTKDVGTFWSSSRPTLCVPRSSSQKGRNRISTSPTGRARRIFQISTILLEKKNHRVQSCWIHPLCFVLPHTSECQLPSWWYRYWYGSNNFFGPSHLPVFKKRRSTASTSFTRMYGPILFVFVCEIPKWEAPSIRRSLRCRHVSTSIPCMEWCDHVNGRDTP